MEITMYQRLLLLPLFNGLTREELTMILARIHVDFGHFENHEVLAYQGDRCENLIYLLNGELMVRKKSADGLFSLTEYITETTLLEPWNIFGMTQHYERTYTSHGGIDVLIISKKEFLNVMMNYQVIKTNILSLLCARIQKLTKMTNLYEAESVRDKMVRFLCSQSLTLTGYKVLALRMEDLASIIKETRLNVSRAIKEFEDAKLTSKSNRGILEIFDMQKLLNYCEL